MRSILVISPNYLHAVYDEIGKYSFHLMGYGSFKAACEGILRVNSHELIGVAYLGDRLPISGSEEHKYAEQFLNMCDLLDQKYMIFVCKDALQSLGKTIKSLQNLKVLYVGIEDTVTDTVINKDMIGSLLLELSDPYKLKKKQVEVSKDDQNYLIKYTPAINDFILECIKPIDELATVQLTLENDTIYHNYIKANNNLLALLRKKRIQNAFGLTDVRSDNLIETMLDSVTDDALWCVYHSIYEMG